MAKKNKSTKAVAIAKQALQVALSTKPARKNNNVRGQSASMQGGSRNKRDPRLAKAKESTGALAQYEAALMSPFSEQALGARVPDSYSFPSEVRHAKTVYTLSANANGNLDCVVLPHPLYTVISGIGTLSGGVTTPETIANLTQTGLVSQATLAGIFGNYRLVGGGVRIKWSRSYNDASGRIFIALQPSPANIPYFSVSTATKSNIYDACDVPFDSTAGGIPTSIITLPYSMEIPASELIGNGVEIPLRISSAAFSEWREANFASTGPSLTVGLAPAGGGTIEEIVGENFVACDGFSTVMLRGTNLPTGNPCLDIEVILHFEGTPAVQTGTVMAGASSSPVVNVTGMFAALAKQNNSPFAKKIGSVVGTAVRYGLRNTTVGRMAKVLGFMNP